MILLCFLRLCLFAFIILQRRLNGFLGEHRAVHFVGRETVESFRHGFVGELHRVLNALTLYKLRRHRAGRDRACAAEGLELDVADRQKTPRISSGRCSTKSIRATARRKIHPCRRWCIPCTPR